MRVLLVVAMAATFVMLPLTASKASGAAVDTCLGYRAAMETARAALERGDRQGAIAALEKAKTALADCRREEARTSSPLAMTGRTIDRGA